MVDLNNCFVKQFEADVHLAYQQMGTKLRSTVRTKSNVVGMSTTFQKIGRGSAGQKKRHGLIPVMNLNHEPVECVLQDYYVGDTPLANGAEARKWLGITWVLHNGLPCTGTNRDCFIYHSSAIGHASGQEVKTDITWHGERAAHFVSNSMSQGACLIDNDGVVKAK